MGRVGRLRRAASDWRYSCWSSPPGFAALGVWQIHRLAWKEALIARVDARVHAAPFPRQAPADGRRSLPENSEYLRVSLTGQFENAPDTLVKAVTERGPGFWVMAPFADQRGFTVLVNRGFVSDRKPAPCSKRQEGLQTHHGPAAHQRAGRGFPPVQPAAGRALVLARCRCDRPRARILSAWPPISWTRRPETRGGQTDRRD